MIQHHRLIRDPARFKVRRIIREMLASRPAPATSCGKGDRLRRGYDLGYDTALKLVYKALSK